VVTVGKADLTGLPPGGVMEDPVRMVVADNGPGIEPELQERLFQPFVTHRPGGSGLGLAIVQRAVEAHRGLVLVDSEPGKGATFTVYLPSRPYRENAA
jgi:signal transduction histidine kinase